MTDDIIYYDIDILNNQDSSGDGAEQIINFSETRNSPYIQNPDEYYMSIIRFSISDTSPLPVFIPEMEPGGASHVKTIYQVLIQDGAYKSDVISVEYTPYYNQIAPLIPPSFENQAKFPFYYVYNYDQFLGDVNTALEQAFLQMKSRAPPGSFSSTDTAPFFTFDNVDKKFRLYALRSLYDAFGRNVEIFFNTPFKKLFSSFPVTDYGLNRNTSLNPLRFKFMIESQNNRDNLVELSNVSRPRVTTAATYFELESQELDIVLWNPVHSIVFSSSSLPVVPTNTSSPASLVNNNGNNKNTQTILTDFQVNITADNSYRNSIAYSPQSEYRLFSINSSQPLNTIDINVWWKTKFGDLIPLVLPPGGSANLKIMFRKKTFNGSSH